MHSCSTSNSTDRRTTRSTKARTACCHASSSASTAARGSLTRCARRDIRWNPGTLRRLSMEHCSTRIADNVASNVPSNVPSGALSDAPVEPSSRDLHLTVLPECRSERSIERSIECSLESYRPLVGKPLVEALARPRAAHAVGDADIVLPAMAI